MVTDAQKRATSKYNSMHYSHITLRIPKAEAEILENVCKLHNYSKAGFIRQAIKEKIDRDGLLMEDEGKGEE